LSWLDWQHYAAENSGTPLQGNIRWASSFMGTTQAPRFHYSHGKKKKKLFSASIRGRSQSHLDFLSIIQNWGGSLWNWGRIFVVLKKSLHVMLFGFAFILSFFKQVTWMRNERIIMN